jgi:hypothetical protein
MCPPEAVKKEIVLPAVENGEFFHEYSVRAID